MTGISPAFSEKRSRKISAGSKRNDTEGEQNADVSLCTETAEKKIDDEALISLFFDIEKPGRRPSENSVRIILPV